METKYYWYRTMNRIPRLNFSWLRSSNNHFYLGFTGDLTQKEIFNHDAVFIGCMTKEKFEEGYGPFMTGAK